MLPVSIPRRTYLIITIVVSIPLLIWAYINASRTHTILLQEIELELISAATVLEQRLPASYHRILSAEGVLDSDPDSQRAALNKHLQPIVEEISRQYPRFGLGYYSPDLNILAVVPYRPELLGMQAHPNSLKVYETGKFAIATIDKGITRDKEPLLGVNYPLYYNGQIIGHVWANYRTQELTNEFYLLFLRNMSLIIVLWLGVLLVVHWSFRRIDTSLMEFAHQIESGRYNPDKLKEWPHLIPVLTTVIQLNAENTKVMEEMAQLDRLKLVSQMAAGVAHEVRNPLTVIKGFLQYFQRKELTAATKEQYNLVLEELSRVEAIIADFLSLAKNQVTEQKRCQINTILEGLQPLLAAEAMKQGIELTLNLDPLIPPTMLNDKEMIQLVLNLSRNAMEAMNNHGSLTIETQAGPDRFLLRIQDTGCGIPEELKKDIFNPFFTTRENGTGLGLAICASIVNRHGGTITVDSSVNQGTTFLISIPLQ